MLEQGHRDDLKVFGGFLALCFKQASQISTDQYSDCVSAELLTEMVKWELPNHMLLPPKKPDYKAVASVVA